MNRHQRRCHARAARRIGSIGNLALNDATAVQHDPDRAFFDQHPDRVCYVRHLLAHERDDWLARGAVFCRPGTVDLVVVKQFAGNSFRVRFPFVLCSVGMEAETFTDAEARAVFDTRIADRTLEDPEGNTVSMREALERFAEAVMQAKRQRH
jgi:hypothetical protein